MSIVKKILGMVTSPLQAGAEAPDFETTDHEGNVVKLSRHRGESAVVLYFYPKDDTPGCTAQACSFRDKSDDIKDAGAVIYGISFDGADAHTTFSQKYNLNFPLLVDSKKEIGKKYGVGIAGLVTSRVTFVIDKEGIIRKVIDDVPPAKHPDVALETLKSL